VLLKAAAGSLATWLLAACTPAQPSPAAPAGSQPPTAAPSPSPPIAAPPATSPSPAPASASPALVGGRLLGYAFNTGSKDVTLFDVAARQPLETKPLDATVRWLSNEQRFWDGRYIWTYDFPDDRVQAIAVDPRTVSVARKIPAEGKGPAHSLMLTPDRKSAWVNVAGDDFLAVIDLASGQIAAQVKTGKFP